VQQSINTACLPGPQQQTRCKLLQEWTEQGLKSHSTPSGSFRGRSSQPISWLGTEKTTLNKTNNKNQSDLNYQRNTPVVDSWGQTDRWTDTVPLHRPFHKLCKQCQQVASVKKHNAAINGRYSQTRRHTRLTALFWDYPGQRVPER